MGLTKHRIGEFVSLVSIKCGNPTYDNVMGINIDKQFMPSRYVGADTSKYSVVPPNCFAFNLMHVGRDEKIPVALNNTGKDLVVSPAYFVFKIIDESIILPSYLYIIMSSPEFDRYAWFCTDSSIRGNLEWSRFCEIDLSLPSIKTQQKYVDIYNSLQKNIDSYKSSRDKLINTYDLYISKLISEVPKKSIGGYIGQSEEKNSNLAYEIEDVKGISIDKVFIETKAKMKNVLLTPYLVVEPESFAYVTVTSRNGDKISIAYNDSNRTYIVSSSYIVFKCTSDELLPSYLFMYLSRPDFDRFARFNSWGSAREVLNWEDLCRYEIPFPSVEIQKDIVEIFNEYGKRQQIINKLENMRKSICPILIKGSLMEA
ncbi:type I restriction enzyme S subunit [Sporosarcina luteola]|nr:type I restriction enzyme S subunit [Sporosarcina luteola]